MVPSQLNNPGGEFQAVFQTGYDLCDSSGIAYPSLPLIAHPLEKCHHITVSASFGNALEVSSICS